MNAQALPALVAAAANATFSSVGLATPVQQLPAQMAELEHRAMTLALAANGGNRVAATRALGISRTAFYDKLRRWPELALVGR